ncbi:MAG: carbohydrate-binding protein, partial [Brevinematales bacterium]|nr:carbohydrate-binding protein [Brevinematales bacterium]
MCIRDRSYTLRVNFPKANISIDNFNFKLDYQTIYIPQKIEAENYNTMSNACISTNGTVISTFGDRAGNSYWLEYDITVPATRAYTLIYRVSSPGYSNHKLSFATNGVTISTVNVPESEWTTVQTTVNLSAGAYPIRIYSTGGRYFFDWFELR